MNIKKSLFAKYPVAKALGLYSIAIGVAELIKPGMLARTVGLKDNAEHKSVLRLRGLRELISGVGIVAQPKPTGFLWSRVAGDLIDFALIGKAMSSGKNSRSKLTIAAAAFAGVALVDLYCSLKMSKQLPQSQALLFRRSIKIAKSPEQLYELWRRPETLPKIMADFASFEYIDDQRGHWKIPASVGPALEWEAWIVTEHEGMYLRWESVAGTTIPTYGWVRFRPVAGGKTGKSEVILSMCFDPPGGALGDAALQLVQTVPEMLLKHMLKQFKQLAESSEIAVRQVNQANLKVSPHPGGGAGAF